MVTFYELVHGDLSANQEFAKLDNDILKSAIIVLVKQGKAQGFQGPNKDDLGVKFY